MQGTPGFFTPGEIGNTAVEARGNEALPSTFGESFGAQFEQAFVDNPATRLARYAWRNRERFGAEGGILNGYASNQPELSVEDLNARFGIPGKLTFTSPVSERVAQDIHEHHRANIQREDIIRRRGEEVGGGVGAGITASLLAGFLDPLNVASAFIPVAGQANIARMLGAGAARGALGRAAVRGIEGAAGGLVGGLATEPLNAFLSMQDYDDYTMGQFIANLAIGTALGAGINAGVGQLRDRSGLPPWSPEMQQGARVQTLAALVEGEPVRAGEAMEFVAARDAVNDLRKWQAENAKRVAEVDDLMRTAASKEDVQRTAQTRLSEVQAESARIRAELADLNSRLTEYGIDPITQDRLGAIDAELGRTIPAKRRADLEAERTMLLEGRDLDADAAVTLDNTRTEAQIAGLSAAEKRAERAVRLMEANARRAEAAAEAAGTLLQKRAAVLASQQDMLQELTERTLRQAAQAQDIRVTPRGQTPAPERFDAQIAGDDIAAAASRILRASPDTVDQVIAQEVDTLTFGISGTPFPRAEMPPLMSMERMQRTMDVLDASRARAAAALTAPPPPEARPSDVEVARAPKVESDIEKQIAEAEKSAAEVEQALRVQDQAIAAQAKAEGRPPPAEDPVFEQMAAAQKEGDALAKAYEAAAICSVRTM
jgi:hypothetical protein